MMAPPGTLVLADGMFDPLHHGHVVYLRAAAEYGTLVVNVAPDAVVAQKHPPLLTAHERAQMLAGIAGVTFVRIGDLAHSIRLVQPRYLVKGDDWRDRLPEDVLAACREVGAEPRYLNTRVASSSTVLAHYQRRVDATAVAALEQFVQTQAEPAPWKPVTDYSLEARRIAEGPLPELINRYLIKCDDADVLDWGCGPGRLIQLLREIVPPMVYVTGYDPHEPEFNAVPLATRVWDLVICREVFEHVPLREWPALVGAIARRAAGFVYLTTRFHPNPLHLLDVTADGHREIDPTEITFATKDLLRTLFVLHGCKSRPDLEARMDWKGLGRCLVFER